MAAREGSSDGGLLEKTNGGAGTRCETSNHICFYSKQSGANTAGSSGLLLKAFWGLLRAGPDRVIYPLFAEWTGIECDVYGRGIPISHPCQGHLRA